MKNCIPMSRRETIIVTIVLIILGKSRFIREHWPWALVLIVIGIVLIGFLTYHAPDWIVFADLG